jgi:phosphatidylserine/phosphatidylglycerophosphate/cardiolipin synthase-like enzyme
MDRVKLQLRCHTKGIIVDREAVLLGRHNLTNAGSLYNRDASLIVRDAEVAQYFTQIYEYDWTHLPHQRAEEVVGGIRIADADEPTPPGFRRVSRTELAAALG